MARYWLSWNQPGDDPRPLTVEGMPDYWVSGTGEGYSTLCAVVDASSEKAAWKLICDDRYWPDAGAVRFCNAVVDDWQPDPGRFPPRGRR